MSNKVWLIDTSVLCNILSVPNMDQKKQQVLGDFDMRINKGDSFLLPYTVIIETGNHIGHASGDRYTLAQKFVKLVEASIKGQTPWKLMKIPDIEKVGEWLNSFPDGAKIGQGYGDHSIVKEWEEFRTAHQGLSVSIWSLDKDLAGYG